MKRLARAFAVAALAACLTVPAAHASVVIAGTRVVVNATLGEATIRLTNHNTRPALVEAWIDAGNLKSTPDSVHTPFLITPPLFRMNAQKDQSLRIIYVKGKKALPENRESLFWLNVLEVPPKLTGQAAQQNALRFAIRTRIKVFYRPGDLMAARPKAPQKLTWSLAHGKHGLTLTVHNPTPYYLTLSKVTLTMDGHAIETKTGMVAPFGTLDLAVPKLAHVPSGNAQLVYYTINDFGAAIKHEGVATP